MTGRPPLYTQELAEEICELIAEGSSLVAICKRDEMPSYATVTKWLRSDPDFAANYAQAREAQADYHAYGILDIADDVTLTSDDRRVRIDARKWIAGKMKPKVYGDKTTTEVTGADGGAIKSSLEVSFVRPNDQG